MREERRSAHRFREGIENRERAVSGNESSGRGARNRNGRILGIGHSATGNRTFVRKAFGIPYRTRGYGKVVTGFRSVGKVFHGKRHGASRNGFRSRSRRRIHEETSRRGRNLGRVEIRKRGRKRFGKSQHEPRSAVERSRNERRVRNGVGSNVRRRRRRHRRFETVRFPYHYVRHVRRSARLRKRGSEGIVDRRIVKERARGRIGSHSLRYGKSGSGERRTLGQYVDAVGFDGSGCGIRGRIPSHVEIPTGKPASRVALRGAGGGRISQVVAVSQYDGRYRLRRGSVLVDLRNCGFSFVSSGVGHRNVERIVSGVYGERGIRHRNGLVGISSGIRTGNADVHVVDVHAVRSGFVRGKVRDDVLGYDIVGARDGGYGRSRGIPVQRYGYGPFGRFVIRYADGDGIRSFREGVDRYRGNDVRIRHRNVSGFHGRSHSAIRRRSGVDTVATRLARLPSDRRSRTGLQELRDDGRYRHYRSGGRIDRDRSGRLRVIGGEYRIAALQVAGRVHRRNGNRFHSRGNDRREGVRAVRRRHAVDGTGNERERFDGGTSERAEIRMGGRDVRTTVPIEDCGFQNDRIDSVGNEGRFVHRHCPYVRNDVDGHGTGLRRRYETGSRVGRGKIERLERIRLRDVHGRTGKSERAQDRPQTRVDGSSRGRRRIEIRHRIIRGDARRGDVSRSGVDERVAGLRGEKADLRIIRRQSERLYALEFQHDIGTRIGSRRTRNLGRGKDDNRCVQG